MKGSTYKRGATWTAQFTVGTYRRGDRRTISKGGFARKKDARAWLTEQLARYGKGDRSVTVRPSSQTLAEFLGDWLEVQRRTRKPSTVGGYENIVRSWVVPHIGQVQLCDLDWRVFVGLYDHLRQQGGRPTKAARARAAAYGTKPVMRRARS